MRLSRLAPGLFVLAAVTLALPSPALAYVCSRVPDSNGNPQGASTAWFSRSVPRYYHESGTRTLDTSQTFSALDTAFSVWQQGTLRPGVTCASGAPQTSISFAAPQITSQTFVGYNFLAPETNKNLLIFRDSGWSHERDVIALTTTTYNALTGEIFDADIEFNSEQFAFSVGDPVRTDLINTAAHEIGHFLGFAHSLDQRATMYAEAPLHDVQKRQLNCDDAAILAFRYPAGTTSVGYCNPPNVACGFCARPGVLKFKPSIAVRDTNDGRGGCQALGAGPLTVVGVLALLRRRRPIRTPTVREGALQAKLHESPLPHGWGTDYPAFIPRDAAQRHESPVNYPRAHPT